MTRERSSCAFVAPSYTAAQMDAGQFTEEELRALELAARESCDDGHDDPPDHVVRRAELRMWRNWQERLRAVQPSRRPSASPRWALARLAIMRTGRAPRRARTARRPQTAKATADPDPAPESAWKSACERVRVSGRAGRACLVPRVFAVDVKRRWRAPSESCPVAILLDPDDSRQRPCARGPPPPRAFSQVLSRQPGGGSCRLFFPFFFPLAASRR